MEEKLILRLEDQRVLILDQCAQTLYFSDLKTTRTTTGELALLTKPSRKYKSIICGSRTQNLSCDLLFPGCIVDVGCLQRLWQSVACGAFTLNKNYLESSLYFVGANQKTALKSCVAPGQGTVSYRPLLRMMVMAYKFSTNAKKENDWIIELDEI
jgi:hypothetical protein